MKFMVTGGAGFIGSHLSRFLIEHNHEVVLVDNLCRGRIDNIKDIRNQVDFHHIDILDFEQLQNIAKGIDGIFHHAALASVPQSFKEPDQYYKANVVGTNNVLKLASHLHCKVVYSSSSSVYGNQTKFPINEDAKKHPLNPYGETKLYAEQFASQYAQNGVKVIILRYFNVFGIGQNPYYAGVIPKFVDRVTKRKPPIIEGNGEQIRSFIYVDDVVVANWLAFSSTVDHSFINIAAKTTTSINELAKIVIDLVGLSLTPKYVNSRLGDIQKSYADISLAKKLLGWKPQISLESGLQQIFQHYL